MDVDISTCPFCYYEYNQTTHIPRILPKCCHTICSNCLVKLIDSQNQVRCPVDHGVFDIPQTIESLPINTKALAIIEERSKIEFCSKHCEEIIKICVTDKTKLCRRCISSNTHKDHEIRSLEEIRSQGAVRREQLENLIQEYNASKDELSGLIKKEQKVIVENLHNRMETLKQLLDQQKESVTNSINLFFSFEEKKFDSSMSMNLGALDETQRKIARLHQSTLNEEYLKILEEELPVITTSQASEQFNKSLADLQYKFEGSLSAYEKAVEAQIRELKLLLIVNDLDCSPENNVIILKKNCEISISDDFKNIVLCSKDDDFETDKQMHQCIPITTHNLNQLEHIKLIFNTKESVKEIIENLAVLNNQLPMIPFLELNFIDKQLEDNDLIEVIDNTAFTSLTKMNIETLSWNFEGCSNLGDLSISKLFTEALSKITTVKDLELYLGNTEVSDQALSTFIQEAFPMLTHLERLKLQLHTTPITETGLLDLFVPMPNMKVLELDLSNTETTNTAIEAFTSKTLPSMKKLDTLKLNLSNTEITNNSLGDLVKNVRIFKLSLSHTKVSSSGVNSFLKKCVGVMEDLEAFELCLDYTDVEEEKLGKVLSTFKLGDQGGSLMVSCKQGKSEKINESPDKTKKSVFSKLTKKLTHKK